MADQPVHRGRPLSKGFQRGKSSGWPRSDYRDWKRRTMRVALLPIRDHETNPRITYENICEFAPEFIDGAKYSRRELSLMAEKLLREDDKDIHEHPMVLFGEHLKERKRREIYCKEGAPDPSIVSGMYWRTHPQGRKWTDQEKRKKTGQGFYR